MTADVAGRYLAWWGPRARASEAAHYKRAATLKHRQLFLTSSAVVLSAVAGSVLFATSSNQNWKVALGIVALVAAVLTALDRVLGYAEEAERNRASGAEWSTVVNTTE